jgi:hypothetical protein
MDKRDFTITITIIGLSVLFMLASSALFLFRGKSKFWTAKKIKFGAALLTLTSITSSCIPIRTCYEPTLPDNMMYISQSIDTINMNDSTKIYGYVENRVSSYFSYQIQNKDSLEVYRVENIQAVDGTFDDYNEEFVIDLDSNLISGNYHLKLYSIKKEDQNEQAVPQNEYNLKIKNNK